MQIRLFKSALVLLLALAPIAQAQLDKPTLKSVTPAEKSAQVSYSAVAGATSYNIYWSTSPQVTPQNFMGRGNSVSSAFTAMSLVDGTLYYFVVTAVTQSDESGVSNEMSVTPTGQPAAAQPRVEQPAAAVTPAQPTTNVGQSSDTNVQNPTLRFVPFMPTDYPIVGSTAGTPNGKITFDSAGVDELVQKACTSAFTPPSSFQSAFDNRSTYVVINVINLGGSPSAQSVTSNNWYVYSKHKTFAEGFAGGWKLTDFDGATRLYGANKILLLSIVENDLTNHPAGVGPTISYTLTITKQQATNVSDVSQLLGMVFKKQAVPGQQESKTPNYWACSAVPVAYKTSTIKVALSYTASNNTPYIASQSFVNEAKEYWDVSFALPVTKASALEYNSTANTVTSSQINKSALFAVIDWYPYPVDLKNSKFNYIPGIFAGVAMNSQPLHSLIFGGSIGTRFAQVYAGALLIKQQQLNGLSVGDSASPQQITNATGYAYKPSFSVGIKISISAAASSISGSK